MKKRTKAEFLNQEVEVLLAIVMNIVNCDWPDMDEGTRTRFLEAVKKIEQQAWWLRYLAKPKLRANKVILATLGIKV
jgi:hypothetical protein